MRRTELPTVACPACAGRTTIPAHGTGEVLRREREARDVPRAGKTYPNQGLVHHFGFSESYTIDLENDVRPWSWSLVESYRAAIEAAVATRLESEVEV